MFASTSHSLSPVERVVVIVHVHQYREGDAKQTVESGDEVVNQDTRGYVDQDGLGPDEGRNQFEHDDRITQRRGVVYDGVTEFSVPVELCDSDDSETACRGWTSSWSSRVETRSSRTPRSSK